MQIPQRQRIRRSSRTSVCVTEALLYVWTRCSTPRRLTMLPFLSCYFSHQAKKERRQRFIGYITPFSLWAKIKLSQSRIIYNRSTCLLLLLLFLLFLKIIFAKWTPDVLGLTVRKPGSQMSHSRKQTSSFCSSLPSYFLLFGETPKAIHIHHVFFVVAYIILVKRLHKNLSE